MCNFMPKFVHTSSWGSQEASPPPITALLRGVLRVGSDAGSVPVWCGIWKYRWHCIGSHLLLLAILANPVYTTQHLQDSGYYRQKDSGYYRQQDSGYYRQQDSGYYRQQDSGYYIYRQQDSGYYRQLHSVHSTVQWACCSLYNSK